MRAEHLIVDPIHPERDVLAQAVEVLVAGGVVAFPTDTFYGLAVDPGNARAVDRLFRVKGRPADRAIPLIAADSAQVDQQVGTMPPLAHQLAAVFWPGPLTLVIPATPGVLPSVRSASGGVAVRVPAHPVARELARLAGHPITATSANRSGAPAPATARAVLAALADEVDVVLDVGETPGGPPSTIVDVTGEQARLVRGGAVPWNRVIESLR